MVSSSPKHKQSEFKKPLRVDFLPMATTPHDSLSRKYLERILMCIFRFNEDDDDAEKEEESMSERNVSFNTISDWLTVRFNT